MSFGNNVYNTLNGNNGTSFTPGISFGNASVGITYTTQEGYYQRVGNIVFFFVKVELSNKGSSTGVARITNFPIAGAANPSYSLVTAFFSDIAFSAGYTVGLLKIGNSGDMQIMESGDNVLTGGLTDAAFVNTSVVEATGFYFV
jgi:hypothetical protein